MFEPTFIQSLKQSNVSRDSDKTRDRVETFWKTSAREDKDEIVRLSGTSRATIYRIYKKGGISAKLVTAMAQVCHINPYYLTGESDDRDAYSEENLEEFLLAHGYKKLLASAKRTVPHRERKPRVSKNEPEALPELPPAFDLDEDRAITLLLALYIRSEVDEKSAATLKRLQALLLS